METVFMFSGQGSQYFQMGKPLYESDERFRRRLDRLDEVARQSIGRSVVDAMYAKDRARGERFDSVLLTHPAIFMVEYALAQSLIEAGVRPDVVLGVSVGSFAAAAVAGFVDGNDALRAVIRQATLLSGCETGGMTAVLADPALFEEEWMNGRGELAAVNFAAHFVVSAKQADLEGIEAVLKERGIGFQRLPVAHPFHSRWIDGARQPFASFMRTVATTRGTLPLASCDRTTVLTELDEEYFWHVVRRPIRFREMTARLEERGARRYIDVGPAGTLATFLKYGLPPGSRSTAQAVLTPFGTDRRNFSAVTEH